MFKSIFHIKYSITTKRKKKPPPYSSYDNGIFKLIYIYSSVLHALLLEWPCNLICSFWFWSMPTVPTYSQIMPTFIFKIILVCIISYDHLAYNGTVSSSRSYLFKSILLRNLLKMKKEKKIKLEAFLIKSNEE